MSANQKAAFALEHRLDRLFGAEGAASEDRDFKGRAQQEEQWVLTKGKVLADVNGQPTRIAGLTVDITKRKLVAASLKASEDRWQLALEATNDGIWDWNIDTNELFVSPRLKQMLGYEAHEFSSDLSAWASRIHPADVDRVLAASQAYRAQKTPYYTAEYRLLCQDGHYMWVLDRAKALRDGAGKAIRMTGSISDIDARKQAEADLNQLNQELELRVEERTAAVKKSELRFRSLFESAPDFIYVLDEQGLIQQVNPTVTAQAGYEATEMIGKAFTAFLSEGTQAMYQSKFADLLATGSYRQEMEFICKDGRVLMMDCSYTVVLNDQAEDYVLVLQRDITQRQKDEQERVELLATLQESERRWQSFLDNVQLLVVGLDATGKVEYVNPCCVRQMGCSKDRILGENWFELFVPASQQPRSQAAFEDILQGEDYPNYQNNVVTCNGDERLISWNTTLLKDTQGLPAGTLSIGEDITERHAVDRMKSEFISVVSHELRTPLTAIHGALDLLSTGLIDPQSERGQHVFGLAVENSDRLVKLVNDILELERLESGKIRLHKVSISTKALTHRIAELLELVAERAGIKLEIAQTDFLMLADCDRLIQVLTNLIGNAIKFSEAPATIWIDVEEILSNTGMDTGSVVQFTVTDEGRGIPPDKVSSIFERFHQVDASDSRSKGGTGLGLAICRSIVQQHGGDIWVESTLGQGSRFIFTIPAH
ncbi:MAG: PAS domain S-box protein [Phormidesmis sp.]